MRDLVPVWTFLSVCGFRGLNWMRDWGVLVGGLVAGDGADVAALVIDVDLARGRVGQQVPFVGWRRIGIGWHIDDWRGSGRRRRRRRSASRDCERQKQGKRGWRNLPIHDAAQIGAREATFIFAPDWVNRKPCDACASAVGAREGEDV